MKDTLLSLHECMDMLPDAVIVVDGTGQIVFSNARVQGLLGYASEELAKKDLESLIPEPFRSRHKANFEAFHHHGKPTTMGMRPLVYGLSKSGSEIPISVSIANIEIGGERYSIAVMRDSYGVQAEITDVTVMAETDALTGIGNRLRLSRVLQAAIEESRPFSLLFLDLEKFKLFNDNYGHEVGDQVLQIIAKRLDALVRSDDMAARLGGDEFMLFLDGLEDGEILEQRAVLVASALVRPFRIGEIGGEIGVNIGGATFPRDGTSEHELMNRADKNMYRAKLAGVPYKVKN